jgi:hypothetical protein
MRDADGEQTWPWVQCHDAAGRCLWRRAMSMKNARNVEMPAGWQIDELTEWSLAMTHETAF